MINLTVENHLDVAAEPRSECSFGPGLQPHRGEIGGGVPDPGREPPASLLLVEKTPAGRARLQQALTARGFIVTSVGDAQAALAAAAETVFLYAVAEIGLEKPKPRSGSNDPLKLVRNLRALHPSMRIVVITDHDSFASVILALRAGVDDYLPKPVSEGELVDALLGRTPVLPPIPKTPLGIGRTRWEYIQRILEQCGHNVSEAAWRLRMHRRTLQRILAKRAPFPRG